MFLLFYFPNAYSTEGQNQVSGKYVHVCSVLGCASVGSWNGSLSCVSYLGTPVWHVDILTARSVVDPIPDFLDLPPLLPIQTNGANMCMEMIQWAYFQDEACTPWIPCSKGNQACGGCNWQGAVQHPGNR